MSEKVKFVRNTAALFVAAHWEKPDAERAVRLASALWRKLSDSGFGDKQDTKPKPRQPDADYYAQLHGKHKEMFDRFWNAYGLKEGRNEAAMRWHQLGDLQDAEYRQIISAATAEAGKPRRPEERRKFAQGWLTERRWLDHLESPAAGVNSPASVRAVEYRKLSGDLEHAKRMMAAFPVDDSSHTYWQTEAQRLSNAIESLRST